MRRASRIPHVSRRHLVSTPHQSRNQRHELEKTLGKPGIVADPAGAFDCLTDIRDHTATPASDLVPEDAQRPGPARADRPFGDNPTHRPVSVGDRCHLDHELPVRHRDDERRVVEVAPWSPAEPGRRGFEQASIQADRATSGSERKPVQVYASRMADAGVLVQRSNFEPISRRPRSLSRDAGCRSASPPSRDRGSGRDAGRRGSSEERDPDNGKDRDHEGEYDDDEDDVHCCLLFPSFAETVA